MYRQAGVQDVKSVTVRGFVADGQIAQAGSVRLCRVPPKREAVQPENNRKEDEKYEGIECH